MTPSIYHMTTTTTLTNNNINDNDRNTNNLMDNSNTGSSTGRESKSALLRQYSAPSGIETADLTTIYKIPNEQYQCDQDVLDERGVVLLNKIDEGGFAKVFMAQDFTEHKFACKIIDIGNDRDNIKLNDVKNELFVLEKVKHPHIIRMHQHFIINDSLYIFMDYANSGNMFNFMQLHGALSEPVAKKPFAQIVSGVCYMHAQKIAHRDLKLSNILLDSDPEANLQILIADFGLSRVVFRRKKGMVLCKSYCGTPNYMAPELKCRKRYNAFMIDNYALGVMLFVIISAAYPFNVRNEEKALREAINLDIQWVNGVSLSDEVKQLVIQLLQPKESNRMSMRDLVSHTWFKKEMDDIRYTLPNLNLLPRNTNVSRKFSSPADDIRVRETRRKSPSSSSSSQKKKKSPSSSRSKRKESSKTYKPPPSSVSGHSSHSGRKSMMSSSTNKSRMRSSIHEVKSDRKLNKKITMTTMVKRKSMNKRCD